MNGIDCCDQNISSDMNLLLDFDLNFRSQSTWRDTKMRPCCCCNGQRNLGTLAPSLSPDQASGISRVGSFGVLESSKPQSMRISPLAIPPV